MPPSETNAAVVRFRWVRGLSLVVKLGALALFLLILLSFGGHL